MIHFHEKKFRSLPQKKQHTLCCKLLREAFLDEKVRAKLLAEYEKLISWMGIEPLTEIEDRFHFHKEQAGMHLKEHDFLVTIKKNDNATGEPFLPLNIYLDKLRSTHNIGAIIRTVEAFRLGDVYFSEGMARAEHSQVIKTAMGAISFVKTYHSIPVEKLKKPLIALETAPESTPYYDFEFPDVFTLAVGNEEKGLSEHTLRCADHIIHIPLYGRKNSINVAQAFAIAASEIVKQKRAQKCQK